jgi:hypothetical protein
LLAAAFLTRSQTKNASARSLVQDSGTPAWLRAAARDFRRSQLCAKGAEFSGEPVDYGYGALMVNLRIPAAGDGQLYQPNCPPSYDLP